jgi:large subunit ribosomal protein L4|tara:strand:+ start:318 stop:938 length:621 start_codon:yes stop_codon:yes gene_type:complete
MKQLVKNLDNKQVGSVDLKKEIFSSTLRPDIIIRVVNWQLAGRRSGNHKTKQIGEIRGTTAKPWKQKGTGRARSGSLRSPQFRGGAVIFGPLVRNHAKKLPKKVRTLALKSALSAKQEEGKILILDSTILEKPKTSDLRKKIKKLGVKSALFVDSPKVNENFVLASSNIPEIDVLPIVGLNVYDILKRDTLVLTKKTIEDLDKRLK